MTAPTPSSDPAPDPAPETSSHDAGEAPVSLLTRFLGERRALALLALGGFVTLFILVALAQPGWVACFGAMALVYGVAFFAIAAEWFWGRWFAMGIATSGLTMAVLGLVTNGVNGSLIFWGVMHGAIYLPLLGGDMAKRYELQHAWRERWHLDDAAVARIKRSVYSTASALPTLIFYTLAPRPGRGMVLGVLVLASVGTLGLLRLRTWGVLALAGAAVGTAISAVALSFGGSVSVSLTGAFGSLAGIVS
ncbi:MAG: hypothetical protein KAI47_17140 [Deltaproteobacteria bacterium]|nr:hypothetical protein [Deltaproteobacteria bacterium]